MSADIAVIVCLHSELIVSLIESQEGGVEGRICCKLNNSRATVRKSILVAEGLADIISDVRQRLRD